MWRSKTRAFLLRSSIPRLSPIPSQVPSKTLTLVPPPPPHASRRGFSNPTRFHNPKFFSSTNESFSLDDDGKNPSSTVDDSGAGETQNLNLDESHASPVTFEDGGENPSPVSGDPDNLSSLWEESVNADDPEKIFAAEKEVKGAADEINVDEEVESIRETLECPGTDFERSFTKLWFNFNEEVLSKVLNTTVCSSEKLVPFFRLVSSTYESVKTPRTVGDLVSAVSNSAELTKKEAYMLWDFIKEIGSEKGLANTDTLNKLISMFCNLGKAKAGLEVFDKFDEFGCSPDGDTYCFTIEALGKRSMIDAAWAICEKMLNSGCLPDSEKTGKIISFFCKGKKVKEAHLVYLMAMEKKISVPRSVLDFLVGALSRNDETIHAALELLEDYQGEALKYANNSFGSVVHGLCRIKDLKEAKKLLLRMVNLGPAPGNAVFNYVITAFSKEGEMEDAKSLIKVMESRGLRADVYTYSVIMSGFAKGGLMDEAYEIFREAKKRHPKLSPVTYHILIRGYCKLEEFQKALECLKEMKEDELQPNTNEYNNLIQSLCLKAMDWRTSEKLLEEMKESGLYLKGITRSLIAAVKEIEEEEIHSIDRVEA
ncbi:small ribosomal subunit protein mS80 (rPPR6) [Typha latifolia]|uniref:small ribosomal subunit protein mS80 (rPPR6) n=1 Tax=Typha latifolia TaxID=4733 RepID=UPI003C30C371